MKIVAIFPTHIENLGQAAYYFNDFAVRPNVTKKFGSITFSNPFCTETYLGPYQTSIGEFIINIYDGAFYENS